MEERAFATRVVRAQRLSPSFVRVTVTGDSLATFAAHGYDQRVNLMFLDDAERARVYDEDGDWYARWQAERPPLRTYTVRAWRPESAELDLDFVWHGDVGPASRFAGRARPGDRLTVCGPVLGHASPPSDDVAWAPPADASRLLIAADEAAVPAACAIAESVTAATVVLEVPTPDDVLDVAAPPGVEVVWLARSRGEALGPVVHDLSPDRGDARGAVPTGDEDDLWDVPAAATGRFYAWLAGEAGVVVAMRRHLVGERGLDRRAVAFMGYWRRGRSSE